MKIYFIFFLTVIMVLGCSQNISESLKNPLVITSEREIISDLESLENNLYQSLNNSSAKNISLEDILKILGYLLLKQIIHWVGLYP